jgi:hypothetical protein
MAGRYIFNHNAFSTFVGELRSSKSRVELGGLKKKLKEQRISTLVTSSKVDSSQPNGQASTG